MRFRSIRWPLLAIALALGVAMAGAVAAREATSPATRSNSTYGPDEIMDKASMFFGDTTEGLAKAIETAFADHGRPNAYITGSEGSGALVLGLRWGSGELHMKDQASVRVHWSGPSLGLDFGGNLSKVFVLCYDLPGADAIFQRFPGVEGGVYVVAGFTLNYQQRDGIILAPIRTGAGLRAGVNIGYLHYRREQSLNPF
jgi:hypothetical protein